MVKRTLKRIKDKLFREETAKVVVDLLFLLEMLLFILLPTNYIIRMLAVIFVFVAYKFLWGIFAEIDKDKMRLPEKLEGFTEKLPNGAVRIKDDRLYEAILYLYELESKFG